MFVSFSPVYTVLFGQAGDRRRFTGRLTCGPTVLSGCCGYGVDLSVIGGVFVHVLDLQLATSHRYLIPHYSLVTDNLLEQEERQWTKRKPLQKNPFGKCSTVAYSVYEQSVHVLYFIV